MNEIYTCFCKISWLLRIPFGTHILKHMTRTEYYGRGKVHILRGKNEKKSSTLNVELPTEIDFVWLLEWPKSESFQGFCPRTPVRPKWAPPRAYLSRNMRAWRPLEFSKICTCHNLYFEIKKKQNKTKQYAD